MAPASSPSPSGAQQNPCWARRWGENVQWGMKAWSRNRRRGDLPMWGTNFSKKFEPETSTSATSVLTWPYIMDHKLHNLYGVTDITETLFQDPLRWLIQYKDAILPV